MKPEIKERIEQVRRGEVPEGYKQKEHRLFPKGWHYDKLGKHLLEYDELSSGTNSYPIATSSRQGLMLQAEYYNDQRYEDTTGGFHVVPEGYVTYRHMSDDDIFHLNINELGQSVLVSPEYPVFTTTPDMVQALAVNYINETEVFRTFSAAQKKGSTRTRMYFHRLCEFSLPIPPLQEQQKIAEILACCEKAIALKKQLIEEKRRQKASLMQKLLKPHAEWERTTIGSIAQVATGATPDTKHPEYWNGNIRWMNSGELNLKQVYDVAGRITPIGLEKSGTKLIPENCVLVGLAGQGKTRGTVAVNRVALCTNQSIASIFPSDSYCTDYLFYFLESKYDELRKISSGDGSRGGLNLNLIQGFMINLPDMDQQTRIAAILATADCEIDLLGQELEAWQQKRKVLMQLLLTGLVRV